ncbi:MAG: NfeD family protein [Lachnospiraceae bacterium]|nr:NfeD family protein [Lachnospiraceae bacterium]
MEFDMQAVAWLVLLVVMLAAEAVTLGLTTIWFAAGALAAFLFALAGANLLIQILAFFVVSAILLFAMRPVASKWLNKDRVRTNAESLVGKTAVVTEPINNLAGTGQVQVQGQYWTARAVSDQVQITKDARVVIEKISGVKLIVKEEKEWKE